MRCDVCGVIGKLDGYIPPGCSSCGANIAADDWTDDPADLSKRWTGYRADGKTAAQILAEAE